MTVAMASASGVCSQSLTTSQPAELKASVTASSRSRFRRNFSGQYPAFASGIRQWTGQPCQKHPSTKTATPEAVKARSGRTFTVGVMIRSVVRNRRPWRCSAERIALSGRVPRLRFPRMAMVAARLVGSGYGNELMSGGR